jgi:hypothetical protein
MRGFIDKNASKSGSLCGMAVLYQPYSRSRNTYQLGSRGCSYFPSGEAPEGNLGFKAGVRILLQRNY